jgi:GNAT superfamily N-acetyltransferase
MSNLHSRPFEAADLDHLQRIRELAFAPVFRSFRDIVGEPIAQTAFARADAEQAALLAEMCDRHPTRLHIAMLDGTIAGFVSFSLDPKTRIGEIGLNAVHPDHAGRGVGTSLYELRSLRCAAPACRWRPSASVVTPVTWRRDEPTRRPGSVLRLRACGCIGVYSLIRAVPAAPATRTPRARRSPVPTSKGSAATRWWRSRSDRRGAARPPRPIPSERSR